MKIYAAPATEMHSWAFTVAFLISVNHCDFPPFVANSDVTSDATTASYSCVAGHRFPDGTLTKQLTCSDGVWSNWHMDECMCECCKQWHKIKFYIALKQSKEANFIVMDVILLRALILSVKLLFYVVSQQ